MLRPSAHALSAACALIGMFFASGCSGPRMIPVSGVVTLEGKPLDNGTLTFSPVDPGTGRPGSADIGPDGRFSAATGNLGAGLLPGQYRVSVEAHKVEADTPKIDRQKLPLLVPRKYLDVGTSGLTIKVDQGSANQPFKIELTN